MSAADRRRAFLALTSLVLASAGCARPPGPVGVVPYAKEAAQDPYGSWARLHAREGADVPEHGELLAVDQDSLYVLTGTGVQGVALRALERVEAWPYDPDVGILAVHTMTGLVSTLSHGWGLILSAPTWMLFGSAVGSVESRSSRVVIGPGDLPALAGHVRFPAGWPPGLARADLRPHLARGKKRDPLTDAWSAPPP
jgi:hypothetical protein